MGNAVHLLETRSDEPCVELRAHLPGPSETHVPILFLLSSLAFLEAKPLPTVPPKVPNDEAQPGWSGLICDLAEYSEADGWTPADFLSHLKFDESGLKLSLACVRGRAVFTDLTLTPQGDLWIRTFGRGQSVTRWLSYVQGRSHMRPVS